jgi:hypothetical protein
MLPVAAGVAVGTWFGWQQMAPATPTAISTPAMSQVKAAALPQSEPASPSIDTAAPRAAVEQDPAAFPTPDPVEETASADKLVSRGKPPNAATDVASDSKPTKPALEAPAEAKLAASAPAASPATDTPAASGAEATAQATPAAEAAPAAPSIDGAALRLALNDGAARAMSCRQPGDPSGNATVVVTFAPSGRVTQALVNGPPFAGTSTGGCIAARLRGISVPPFSGDLVTVKKTIVFE